MKNARLIIDSPNKNSSIVYASGYYSLDPVIYLEYNNEKIGYFPATEFENVKIKSKLDKVLNLTEELQRIGSDKKYPNLKSSVLIDFFKENNITEITVPETFPIIEANNLKNQNINIIVKKEPFFDERIRKTQSELDYIKDNSKLNSQVMNEVFNILAESSITNEKKLKYDNKILTSEYLQNYILKSFIDKGLYADSVIVSIGDQCCYPHENGYGEIYANQSIIIDIFPKSRYNFYYTDMTRTFCKGRASDDLKKIYEAVSEAQKMCLDSIFAGCDAKILHKNIQEYFYNKGFKTGIINGMLQGFFHGTGHGVGLDCHELPLISLAGDKLPLNSVVTVEPGLYYIGIGGVRIEDIICVKEKSIENFTQFEKKLEIE